MIILTNVEIQKSDIDELGHVNNSKYLSYFEKAREQWYMKASGLSFQDMREINIGTVIKRIDITFNKEIFLGDLLQIKTIPQEMGNKSFVFRQEIINQENVVVSIADVTNVMFDVKVRKSMPVIDEISRYFP